MGQPGPRLGDRLGLLHRRRAAPPPHGRQPDCRLSAQAARRDPRHRPRRLRALRLAPDRVAAVQWPAAGPDAGRRRVRRRGARHAGARRRQGRALHHGPFRLLGAPRDGPPAALPADRRRRARARQPPPERLDRGAADVDRQQRDPSPRRAAPDPAGARREPGCRHPDRSAHPDQRGGRRRLLQPPGGHDVRGGGAGAAHRRAHRAGVRGAAARRPLPDDLRAPGGAAARGSSRCRPRADAALHRRPRDVRAPLSEQLAVDAPALARPAARRGHPRHVPGAEAREE